MGSMGAGIRSAGKPPDQPPDLASLRAPHFYPDCFMKKIALFLVFALVSGCTGQVLQTAAEPTKPIEVPTKAQDAKVAPPISNSLSTGKQQPVVLSYPGRIRASIRANIVYPRDLLSDADLLANPVAEVEVRVAPDGKIVSTRLAKSSGVRDWDLAVQRAVERTRVLPRDVDGKVPPLMLIAFSPR